MSGGLKHCECFGEQTLWLIEGAQVEKMGGCGIWGDDEVASEIGRLAILCWQYRVLEILVGLCMRAFWNGKGLRIGVYGCL